MHHSPWASNCCASAARALNNVRVSHAAPIDNLLDCRLSNPMAANMSVVTSDNQICYVASHSIARNYIQARDVLCQDPECRNIGSQGITGKGIKGCYVGCKGRKG